MISCRLCGTDEVPVEIDSRVATLAGERVPLRPVLCMECGLVYLQPQIDPDLLTKYYTTQHRLPSPTMAYVEQVGFIGERFRGGVVLDVGAYDGRLLQALGDEHDIAAHGVEPDTTVERVVDYVDHPDLKRLQYLGLEFDLITLGHTLEHLVDPWATLRDCHELLTDDGTLFVEVPDLIRPQVQVVPYWTPQHLWYWTGVTLMATLAQCGFVTVELEITGYDAVRVLARKEGNQPGATAYSNSDQVYDVVRRYINAREVLLDAIDDRLPTDGTVAVFGAGEHTAWLAQEFPAWFLMVDYILDSTPVKRGVLYGEHGPVVTDPATLPPYVDHVVISSYDSQEEMAAVFPNRAVKLYDEVRAYDVWGGGS